MYSDYIFFVIWCILTGTFYKVSRPLVHFSHVFSMYNDHVLCVCTLDFFFIEHGQIEWYVGSYRIAR